MSARRLHQELLVRRLDGNLPIPSYAHESDAGLDLYASADVKLEPGERHLLGAGVAVVIPDDHVGLICPRSGLAMDHGITILNGPGIIDHGYTGEVRVVLINLNRSAPYQVRRGDRIAQLIIVPVPGLRVREVPTLPTSQRGDSGFGGTGR